MALTKVTGQVIKSDTNITSHNINSSGIITAVSFSGPFSGTGGNFTGIITATAATFSGNVTIGGTLTYEDVTNIDSVGVVTARAGIDLTGGNITLGDSGGSSDDRIKLGADGDLSIYHNGSAGYISNTSSALYLQAKTGQNGINIWPDGVLQLHHSGSEKLETQSWGFWSHGSIKPSADTYDLGGNHVSNRWNDIFVADTGEINIGDGSDLTIQHNATNSVIKNITGDLEFQEHTSSGNIIFKTTTSGTERLSIKSDGKIGIGSAVPAYNLDISGSGTQQLAIQSTNANDAVLRLNNSVLNWDLDNDGNGGIAAAGSLHLRNSSLGDAAVMSFTSAGNVGIGTIAPGALLHLSTATPVIRLTDTDTSGPIHTNIDGASGYLTLDVGSVHRDVIITSVNQSNEIARFTGDGHVVMGNSGTEFGNAPVQSFSAHGNTAGESGFSSVDTTSVAAGVGGEIAFHGKYNTGAQDYAYLGHIRGIKENATAGNTACALTFHTRPTLTAPQERLRIDSSGNVAIGHTTAWHNYASGATGTSTRLAAVHQTGTGWKEMAHFAAGTDSDDTGSVVRLSHYGNDRGAYLKAGRGSSDRAIAYFGLRNSANTDTDLLTFRQDSGEYRTITNSEFRFNLPTSAERSIVAYGNHSTSYNLGSSGGAAIRFKNTSGDHSIEFDTHWSGDHHATAMTLGRSGSIIVRDHRDASIGRDYTSGTLTNGQSVSYNGSGTTLTNGRLNLNSVGGNAGAWLGALSVAASDGNPSGSAIIMGSHGQGFNVYNRLLSSFDGGITVTWASGNWSYTIANSSGDTIYYRFTVIHLGTKNTTVNGR